VGLETKRFIHIAMTYNNDMEMAIVLLAVKWFE